MCTDGKDDFLSGLEDAFTDWDYQPKKTTYVKAVVVKKEESEKHMPADVTAGFKFLALRRKNNWIEVSKSEHRVQQTSMNIDLTYVV